MKIPSKCDDIIFLALCQNEELRAIISTVTLSNIKLGFIIIWGNFSEGNSATFSSRDAEVSQCIVEAKITERWFCQKQETSFCWPAFAAPWWSLWRIGVMKRCGQIRKVNCQRGNHMNYTIINVTANWKWVTWSTLSKQTLAYRLHGPLIHRVSFRTIIFDIVWLHQIFSHTRTEKRCLNSYIYRKLNVRLGSTFEFRTK